MKTTSLSKIYLKIPMKKISNKFSPNLAEFSQAKFLMMKTVSLEDMDTCNLRTKKAPSNVCRTVKI